MAKKVEPTLIVTIQSDVYLSGVYLIKNKVNGDSYVGYAKRLMPRLSMHCSQIRNGNHQNKNIRDAVETYGADAFEVSILEWCSWRMLEKREVYWCRKLKPKYNQILPKWVRVIELLKLGHPQNVDVYEAIQIAKMLKTTVEKLFRKRPEVQLTPEQKERFRSRKLQSR